MQDGDHDALNFPVLGEPSALPVSLDAGNNKLLVVATLAALIIAGSAIVYRTIPLSSSRTSPVSAQDDAVHKQKKMKLSDPSQAAQKRPEREQGDAGLISYEPRSGSDIRDANRSLLVTPASPSRATEEFDNKESKSSRSKDRRRRGKDPIKEMLKSEKKSRGLGAASPTLSNRDYTTFIKSSSAKDDPTPSSPSTSLFTDPQLTRVNNDLEKNAKSKRTGQREKSNVGPDDTTSDHHSQQARGNSLGSFSGMHSRGTSESISASESTQRQNIPAAAAPSSSSSQVLLSSDHPSHPSTSDPSSSLASDDGLGRPQSSMSASTTSSAGSRQVGHGHLDNDQEEGDLQEWETIIRREKPNKRRRASSSQARPSQSGLASEDEDTRSSHHDPVVAVSTTNSVPQPMKPPTRGAPSSVSVSTEATSTVTGPTSQSSSVSGGMSPATSPSGSSAAHNRTDETDAQTSLASSPASDDTPKSSSKSRKGAQQTGSSDAHDPWDWDGAGNVPSSSSSSNVGEGDRNPSRDRRAEKGQMKERDHHHQKPPRLQQSGAAAVAGGMVPSFSYVAASRLPASSTHPASLNSPTSSSFGQQSSGSGITSSMSAAPGSTTNVISPSSGSDSLYSLGEVKEREEEEQEEVFIFPTLNPTTAVAGSSRTRSSLADNNINNNVNSNTTHYNSPSTSSRRAPTPRRPPTPARGTGTPPPHASSSSSSSSPHPSSSLNSPTHPGGGNGNSSSSMPALSTQTQLASLRGALEAARLREEKNKQEMETYAKDMEALRWENANWRRGQHDLQMQIRHLTHQLQTYASFVASVPPPQLQQQHQANGTGPLPSTNPAATGSTPPPPTSSSAPNGFGSPSGSSSVPATPQLSSASTSGPPSSSQPQQAQQTPATHPHPHPTPPPLHMQQMLSNLQMNGLSSPVGGGGGVLSPLSMSTPPPQPLLMGMPPPGASPSTFYPYPMPPYPPPPPHPYMIHAQQVQYMQQQYQQQQQQQQGSAQPSPHQANVFSSIFPPGPVPPALMSPHQQHQQYSAYVVSHSHSSTSAIPIPYGGGGSRSSSAAGTSSAGSMSPDLSGSPSPGGGLNLNGNGSSRRVRTRTLTASDGHRPWEDAGAGEGWVGADEDDGQDEAAEGEGDSNAAALAGAVGGHEDDYDEGGFNEVLADAILKRPGSIRVRSASRRGVLRSSDKEYGDHHDQEENSNTNPNTMKDKVEVVEQMTEFTFPSLSNIGNVLYRSDVVAVNGGGSGLSSSSSSSSASPAPLPPHDIIPAAEGSVSVPVAHENVVVDPAGIDYHIPTDPGTSESEAGLVLEEPEPNPSVSPESTAESETTPREEEGEVLPASVVAAASPESPTKTTETPLPKADHDEGDERTTSDNNSPVER